MTNIIPRPTNIDVIKCGGKLAEPNINGYSGCGGTGLYQKTKKCFRCAGKGWQNEAKFKSNQAHDRKAIA